MASLHLQLNQKRHGYPVEDCRLLQRQMNEDEDMLRIDVQGKKLRERYTTSRARAHVLCVFDLERK